MDTPRTSDNTNKVPDFSFFDLRQIKTWKTEQLAWHYMVLSQVYVAPAEYVRCF